MNISDVMIHVNETLAANEMEDLENSIRQIDGVIASRFNPNKDHLLLVAYSPESVSTDKLLSQVTTQGYTAQLIGA